MSLLFRGARLVDPAVGLDRVADLLVADGAIAAVGEGLECEGAEVREMQGKVIVPGLVDIHVHFRDPGLEYKEDLISGSASAAHGGFTDVCVMPNTNPTCDTESGVEYILSKARDAHVRIHPVGAITVGLQGKALAEIGSMSAAGAVAFSDDGRGVQSDSMMRRAMDYVKMFGKGIMSHCQVDDLSGTGVVNEGTASTRLGLAGWPAAAEEIQIGRDIALCELTRCKLHIQHITTRGGIEAVANAKAKGLPVTCEVTPHHLFLTQDDIDNSYDTSLKVNPPLRRAEDAEALIEALGDGTIDCIVTDHAPHALHEKALEFELAPFGMIGLETSLGLVLTKLVATGRITLARMVELMAINPREIAGLPQVKLEEGASADLTIIDPEAEWTVDARDFLSKSVNSGFIGAELKGKATDLYIAGEPVMVDGAVL
ncbi:MAG: dihydroorotase [bacterium]|nr:dihydroorotase [bacterium]